MSGRALIAIGCNSYSHLNQLNGAETDARLIYDELIKPNVGDYDADRSHLLLSPDLAEVRERLVSLIFDQPELDTLTFMFAGHGAISGGSYYMATRDSRPEALSATALPLAELLRMIAEAAPKQTYLIIDACQSGGLISDLNVILKSEVMGEFGTPGITLLATAASNEAAMEVGGNGIGTSALLDCIRGEIFLQDSSPALDLVEIGRAVSARISAASGQTPVVWGLNLYGPSSFCKNPHVGNGDAPLRSVLVGWPDSSTAAAIRGGVRQMWEPFVAISSDWRPRIFVDRLTQLASSLGTNQDTRISFVQRISDACAVQASDSKDRFRAIEVEAACLISLLPSSDNPTVAAYLELGCRKIGAMVEEAVDHVIDALNTYPYALVTGGLWELHSLPIRLLQLLGWAGFSIHTRSYSNMDVGPAAAKFADLFDRLEQTYSLSLVSMSDKQAPYVMSAVTAAALANLNEQGERLLGYLFASTIDCGGNVARVDIEANKVLSFLLSRANRSKPSVDVRAQPSELIITLLRLSRLFDLSDEFDAELDKLDHIPIHAYLPDNYCHFGADPISGGKNLIFHIGHDIWSVSDIEAAWPSIELPKNAGMALTSLLASLVFPNRSPWFIMPVPNQLMHKSA